MGVGLGSVCAVCARPIKAGRTHHGACMSPAQRWADDKHRRTRARVPDYALTAEHLLAQLETQEHRCAYCDVLMSLRGQKGGYKLGSRAATLDRIDNTGGYTTDNVVVCCMACNVAKGSFTAAQLLAMAERIHYWRERLAPAAPGAH